MPETADLILHHGRITTLDRAQPEAEAIAIRDGRVQAVGRAADIMPLAGPDTRLIDAGGRRVIPGLIDSHMHVIRGGLNYNMELRWDGVRSLAQAMAMLKAQVAVTPPPQWVRVVGGFTEHQFAEKRLPTLDEINAIAPDTPVFILHLYDRALLNAAALRAVGYTRDTPSPPGAEIQRDPAGNPTGLLVARPNAGLLYATLAKGPRLPPEYQKNSTRHFMREVNRLGVTGVIDAGGGFQNYPDDYAIIEALHREGDLTVRIAYNLFTQTPKGEREDFARWTGMVAPGQGDDLYRHNGAGEMLVFSAADFEDFRQPRPDLPAAMETDLKAVVRLLAEKRWPFRMHATYDETISRALDVFEEVDRELGFDGLRWFFDHAETISPRSIERVKRLNGGIAVQHRMVYQGEDFVARYGAAAAEQTPPVARMLEAAIPVGGGTDATRVASYNPWVALWWLVSGKSIGGLRMTRPDRRLDREAALRLWTEGSAWFSGEQAVKGRLAPGQLADLAVLGADYFAVPEDEIQDIAAVLTILGGRVVHGAEDFAPLAPPLPPAMPDWSPVRRFGGYQSRLRAEAAIAEACACAAACGVHGHAHAWARLEAPVRDQAGFWGAFGCSCWAF
ncbi:amidohydrolase [Roseomonas sp. JC162]|uniref:Amidohydrolase n=1 Tax=Neoroseomonas marina TaxID=1232220 RepID=A0A848E9F2_9PROT|nr:amidohydrolase [Neoroseomonas marina]NMJ41084.1 amidohydrolase [Neoroseomonas marina]